LFQPDPWVAVGDDGAAPIRSTLVKVAEFMSDCMARMGPVLEEALLDGARQSRHQCNSFAPDDPSVITPQSLVITSNLLASQ
jgi:hypothetical protein